jgi:8-oxo-dGTP pyrophosphatase MutT (NUDIX family)
MIKKIKENLVIDNGFIRVYNDTVSFDGKSECKYFRYSLSERFPNYGVAIISEFEDKILLQEVFRYAHQDFLIETVKGMGMKDKSPLETAIIEVKEEMGATVDSIKDIGIIKNDLSDTLIYCFYAKIKKFGEKSLEDTEIIQNLTHYNIKDINKLILEDKIQDTVTMSILLKYLALKQS